MLGPLLLRAARSTRMRHAVETFPATRRVVDRFVAGNTLRDAIAASIDLADRKLTTTLDRLGEDISDADDARTTQVAYTDLLRRLADEGLAQTAEVSLKLSAVGQMLAADGAPLALEHARTICEAADKAGTTVTLDMEDHTTVDSTLQIAHELRKDFPWVGSVLQSNLKRTESDLRSLTGIGTRVRLVKGAYNEPAIVAYQAKSDVDAAYRRGLQILMAGDGYPMVGTHDPAMIEAATRLAGEHGRGADSYELQMLYGVRTGEQTRLAESGHRVRVYVPYGDDWYGYFMRRLAERPANVRFFLKSLTSR